MTILLIRPEGKIDASTECFRRAGIDVYAAPLIKTEACQSVLSLLGEKLSKVPDGAIAIVVSPFAAGLISPYLNNWPFATTIAVGPGTAAVLAASTVNSAVPDLQTTEGMLALPQMQNLNNRHVYLIKGEGGRQDLKIGLQAKGAIVHEVVVYRRVKLDVRYPDAQDYNIQAVVATSGEQIEIAFEVFQNNWLQSLPWIVVSQRTSDIAAKLGIKQRFISDGADDLSLIAATQSLLER